MTSCDNKKSSFFEVTNDGYIIIYSFAALVVYISILKLSKFVALMSIREVQASRNILLSVTRDLISSNLMN